jgi:bifunctional non-homologous end joining protein LigD
VPETLDRRERDWHVASVVKNHEVHSIRHNAEHAEELEIGETPAREPLRFVVHKHQASRLHYDFRLELDGVLKSWAIPKGPSLDPGDKRLAMMVDDHPLGYRNFEGVLPEGYGAGTVMIWDEGTFVALNQTERAESEEAFRTGLERGQFAFILAGQKLKGEFALVRFKRAGEKTWLLLKKRDSFASTGDVAEQDHSARSGRTMEEIHDSGAGVA